MEIVSKVADLLFGKVFANIQDDVLFYAKNRVVQHLAEEYNRCLFIKNIIHEDQPVNLKDIFVKPRVAKNIERKFCFRVENAKTLFEEGQFILIFGDAGVGKSTLIKSFFIDCFDLNLGLPLIIELRSIEEDVEEYVKKILGFFRVANNNNHFENLLYSGRFIFFFDGLDEVTSKNKEKIYNSLNDFIKKYNANRYVIASREDAVIRIFPLFKNRYVCGFNKEEVNIFIEKQGKANAKYRNKKIKTGIQLVEENRSDLFLDNPLLLSLYIQSYDVFNNLPAKRVDLYQQVFDTFFSDHDRTSKLSFNRNKASGLNKSEIRSVLNMFCFIMFFEQKYEFDIKYYREKILYVKNKINIDNVDDSKLLDDLVVGINLINIRDHIYSFIHSSFVEYFCASFISGLDYGTRCKIYEKIMKLIFSPKKVYFDNLLRFLKEENTLEFKSNLVLPFLEKLILEIEYFFPDSIEMQKDLPDFLDYEILVLEKHLNQTVFLEYAGDERTIVQLKERVADSEHAHIHIFNDLNNMAYYPDDVSMTNSYQKTLNWFNEIKNDIIELIPKFIKILIDTHKKIDIEVKNEINKNSTLSEVLDILE